MNSSTGSPTQTAAPAPTAVPLSLAQRRLWFIEQLQPGSAVYNLPIAWRLQGPLDHAAFERALNEVVRRHASLRTTFCMRNDEPQQEISPFRPRLLRTVDLSATVDAEAEARRLIDGVVRTPFDLERGPLVRAKLVRLSEAEHVFIFNAHHIVWDGWSINILRHELTLLYRAFCDGETSPLPELPVQFANVAAEQRGLSTGEVWKEHLDYWKQQLRGPSSALELPATRPRPEVPSFRGAAELCQLDGVLIGSLRELSRKQGATLFMTLLTAFKALLHRYTGQEDILVGSPVAGRDSSGSEDLIGFFVNTVALRTDLGGDPTLLELLHRVRRITIEAYAHQDVPFDRVVQELHPERDLAHPDPLIQVVMGFESGAVHEWAMGALRASVMDIETVLSKFDWTFLLEDTACGVRGRLEYNTDLFEAETIQRFLQHFRILLEGIVENPRRRISEFPLLTATERRQIVIDWNQTTADYERDACVHQLFEAQARAHPEAIALVFRDRQMTYAELNRRASRLAWRLQEQGVGPGVLAGLCLERSFEMIVAMLAILKAGGADVPLDRTYPRARLAFMLKDTAVTVLVTDAGFDVSNLLATPPRLVRVEADGDVVETGNEIKTGVTAKNLAYVMYTSGSTGVPKGVAVPHRGIVRLVRNANYAAFGRDDVFLQLAPISFDASTFEVWGCLLNGGKLVVFPPHAPSLEELGLTIQKHKVTTLWLTAGLFHQMVDSRIADLKSVRQLLAGGDVLSVPQVLKVVRELPGCRLINGYGPTENTTFTCCYPIPADWRGGGSVPIGRPISNTQVYILDKHLSPVPIGVRGELYTGGDGLAQGYWNRPELTAERFIPHPFETGSHGFLYKTGDAVRYLPDGNIQFLGRKDHQVKLSGFRIELGEIETTLGQHAGVRECAVAVRANETGEPRLVAYFVPSSHSPSTASELRRFLGQKLPRYMVPSQFVQLRALPWTPSGKLDRKALPEPDNARPELEKKYASPRDAVELELTRIWENALAVRPIGIEDKFFDLGGHSLLAVRVISQIEKAFGRKLRLATLFQAPTIQQLAAILREEDQETRVSKSTSVVELQSRGTRPPLFLVHGAGGGMFWGYANLSRHLGAEQPVYGFRSRGLEGAEEFQRLEEMAAQYVADMRLVQPRGPYNLGGYCFGGNVAYEMARQLAAQGEEVRVLALINCSPPNTSYERPSWTPLWFGRLLWNLLYWANYCRRWTPAQRRDLLRWKIRMLKRNLAALLHFASPDAAALEVENLVDLSSFSTEQQRLWQVHIRAQFAYRPQPLACRVHLFRSPGHSIWCSFDPKYGWGELAERGVEVFVIPAAHEKILEEPFVAAVATHLDKLLQPETIPIAHAPEPRLLPDSMLIPRRSTPAIAPLSVSD